MLVAVFAETMLFEALGRPDCCTERRPDMTATVAQVSCLDHEAGDNYVVREGVEFRCPRITGRHNDRNRQLLMLHFLFNIGSFFVAWKLGMKMFRWCEAWARRRVDMLESE